MDTPKPATTAPTPNRKRLILMLLGPLVLIILGLYFYLSGGRYESTDDAYVQIARVPVSADVGGRVKEIAVHDNQLVHKGDLLFRLDDASLRIAVDEASAQLAAARLKIDMLKANYRQGQSDLASAKENLAFQQTAFDRSKRLQASGIASQAQLDQATHALDDARQQLSTVQQKIGAVVANLAGNPDIAPDRHPEVQQAQAQLDRAKLNLSYTIVRAPADGVATRVEELQVGSYIAASAPVFALVSTQDTWIEANFKEDQLAHMRAGQSVEVEVDSYRGKTFDAHVASLSPGTGTQFSVLPPENATGNWVKVVQRVPVRIELDHLDPAFPLQGGLSANVSVDTHYQRHLFASGETVASSGTAP